MVGELLTTRSRYGSTSKRRKAAEGLWVVSLPRPWRARGVLFWHVLVERGDQLSQVARIWAREMGGLR